MNYSFDTVQTMFMTYEIKNYEKLGRKVIIERENNNLWEYEGIFATIVNFAHTWVQATMYDSTKEEKPSKKELTEEDINKAFSESSRKSYNAIMECIVLYLQEFGKMPKCETLVKDVSKQLGSNEADDIVRAFYVEKKWHNALVFWSLQVAGMKKLLEDLLEQMQAQKQGKKSEEEKEEYRKPLAA